MRAVAFSVGKEVISSNQSMMCSIFCSVFYNYIVINMYLLGRMAKLDSSLAGAWSII